MISRRELVTGALGIGISCALPISGPPLASEPILESWQVVVAREQYEPLCENATVELGLATQDGSQLSRFRVPLEESKFYSRSDWMVGALAAGAYAITVNSHGCRGIYNDRASVKTTVGGSERAKTVFIVVEQSNSAFELLYVQATSTLSATGVLDLRFDGTHPVAVANLSSQSIVPCRTAGTQSISRDWLLDGKWGEYGYSTSYRWPDDVESIPPGTEVFLESGGTTVTKHPGARRVSPELQRFRFPVEPNKESSVRLGSPTELLIAPSCDIYELQLPVGPKGPRLFISAPKGGLKPN